MKTPLLNPIDPPAVPRDPPPLYPERVSGKTTAEAKPSEPLAILLVLALELGMEVAKSYARTGAVLQLRRPSGQWYAAAIPGECFVPGGRQRLELETQGWDSFEIDEATIRPRAGVDWAQKVTFGGAHVCAPHSGREPTEPGLHPVAEQRPESIEPHALPPP